jgi:hypothetical protein
MKSSKIRFYNLAFVLAVAFALVVAGCHGSNAPAPANGTLSGTADDGTNPLDEYVEVTIVPDGGGTPVIVQSDNSGAYSASLAEGTYDLTATRPGYDNYSITGLTVTSGQTTTHDFSMSALAANTYIGSADCAVCHAANYATFLNTGHNFKLNQVVNATEPTYPFSSITNGFLMIDDEDGVTDNTLGTPNDYGDISYVIGGFGWKARWIDADGYIVTGSAVQYNLADGSMSAYHDDEVDKVYNCGNCHTTGWKHVDPTLNPTGQDGLPGMDGTFDQTGVQCESCHGAGSTHAQTQLATDITKNATARTTADFLASDMAFGKPVACSECHTRDGEKDYPTYVSAYETAAGVTDAEGGRIASSGTPPLIRHHEQYDELLGVDPAAPASGSTKSVAFQSAKFDCITCHNTHTTTIYQDVSGDAPGAANLNSDCLACHPGNAITSGGMTGLNCIDCHMPFMVKSAINNFVPGVGDDRPVLGDIRTHIFSIDLTKDPATEQFSGGFANPWITGEYACRSCHSVSGPSFDITFPNAMTIH